MTAERTTGPQTVRGDDPWTYWAPSGRGAVPAIVLLVIVANLVGVATVVLLLIGVDDGGGDTGRAPVLLAAAAYLVVALPVGTRRRAAPAAGHQPLADGRPRADRRRGRARAAAPGGHRADRRRRSGWSAPSSVGAVAAASPSPIRWSGCASASPSCSAGMATAGVTYLLVARAARAVTAHGARRASAGRQPSPSASGPACCSPGASPAAVPMLGVVLLFLDPSNPGGPGAGRRRLPRRRRAARRRPGHPAHRPRGRSAAARPAPGRAAGRRGRLRRQRRRRRRRRDRPPAGGRQHHGRGPRRARADARPVRPARRDDGRRSGRSPPASPWAARSARSPRCSSTSPARTSLVRRTGPEEMVGLLNRFFEVVVETIEDEGGLVNKFEGDAALCVFGAPTDHDDPAGAALRAARRICDAVRAAGEVDVGVGVACGRVWAGQVGRGQPAGVHGDRRPGERGGPAHRTGQGPPRARGGQRGDGARGGPGRNASTGCATARSSCAAATSRPPPGCAGEA